VDIQNGFNRRIRDVNKDFQRLRTEFAETRGKSLRRRGKPRWKPPPGNAGMGRMATGHGSKDAKGRRIPADLVSKAAARARSFLPTGPDPAKERREQSASNMRLVLTAGAGQTWPASWIRRRTPLPVQPPDQACSEGEPPLGRGQDGRRRTGTTFRPPQIVGNGLTFRPSPTQEVPHHGLRTRRRSRRASFRGSRRPVRRAGASGRGPAGCGACLCTVAHWISTSSRSVVSAASGSDQPSTAIQPPEASS